MDTGSRQALSREIGGEEIGVLLGLHKDQRPLLGVALRVLHQLLQLRALVELGNLVEVLYTNTQSLNSKSTIEQI